MATSSFSKNFVISDQKVVKDLLYAIKKQLASMN